MAVYASVKLPEKISLAIFTSAFFLRLAQSMSGVFLAVTNLAGWQALVDFVLSRLRLLVIEIAASATEYVDKIALRTYSDLECIDDAAFREGLDSLREHSSAHPDFPKLAENDVFIFEKI